jgi:hypothetical protein
MAYALAAQSRYPVVARYGHILNISVHLIVGLEGLCSELDGLRPAVPAFLLTHDVIPDPEDFDRERESLPDDEREALLDQFGLRAFSQHMKL